jgi:hypothetical protein
VPALCTTISYAHITNPQRLDPRKIHNKNPNSTGMSRMRMTKRQQQQQFITWIFCFKIAVRVRLLFPPCSSSSSSFDLHLGFKASDRHAWSWKRKHHAIQQTSKHHVQKDRTSIDQKSGESKASGSASR